MKLFDWLNSFFKPQPPEGFTGVLLDTRDPEEKKTDYNINEMVAKVNTVNWAKKEWLDFRRFPIQDQGNSYSCVWQSMRKLMRVLFKVNRNQDLDFSAAYGYRQRTNYPEGGTSYIDAFKIAQEGVTLNALMASDNLSEEEMNNVKIEQYHRDIAKDFKLPYYVQVPAGDLETVASVIQTTKKGVMLWFYFVSDEWSLDIPLIKDKYLTSPSLARALRHSVVAVDYGIYNGEKGVFIEDSAHFGGKHERFIPEAFFKARNIFAAYPINFSFEPGGLIDPNIQAKKSKPTYNGSVVSLQECLKYEGIFPVNVESTGVYGGITTKAVKDFQAKYLFEQTGIVGPITKAKLQGLYP